MKSGTMTTYADSTKGDALPRIGLLFWGRPPRLGCMISRRKRWLSRTSSLPLSGGAVALFRRRTDRIVVFTIHWLYALPTDAGAVSRVLARL
jgi:hypothetical protein